MKTERPLWSKQAGTPDVRSPEPLSPDTVKRLPSGADPSAIPGAAADQSAAGGKASGRAWAWPRTLRFVIVMSGLFWLAVGLGVWLFLSG